MSAEGYKKAQELCWELSGLNAAGSQHPFLPPVYPMSPPLSPRAPPPRPCPPRTYTVPPPPPLPQDGEMISRELISAAPLKELRHVFVQRNDLRDGGVTALAKASPCLPPPMSHPFMSSPSSLPPYTPPGSFPDLSSDSLSSASLKPGALAQTRAGTPLPLPPRKWSPERGADWSARRSLGWEGVERPPVQSRPRDPPLT